MKRFALGMTMLALSVGISSAADLTTKAQPQIVGTVQVINWTGPYLGATMGYGWKDESTSITGNNALSSGLISSGIVPGSVNLRPSGALLGGVIGYDWQFNSRMVLGLAGDWAWANLRDANTAIANLVNRSVDEKITSFGTIRARLGYLVTDRMLVYGTGGGAWATVRNTITSAGIVCFPGIASCGTGSSSETRWGWVVGGGMEYRLDRNWSLTGEALWANLGTQDTLITGSTAFGCKGPCPLSYTQSTDNKIGIARMSLNYRF